jgi:hypothetical protein
MATPLAGESVDINSDGENHGSCAIRQSWTESVLSQQQQRLSMYNHCHNSNTSNDYFSSREVHVQDMEAGHELGLTLGTLAGSTVTLNSDSPASSIDPSENVAGRERSMTGSGEGENGAEQTLGGFDSTTVLAGSTRFNQMRRASSSPSLRPFKNLSSKLSVNALKKLSASQKSQLNGSKEDLESHRSRDRELSSPSSLVRQEYANYNFERQMEDFQRAAREFKEQKESEEATSGWLLISQASEIPQAHWPESTLKHYNSLSNLFLSYFHTYPGSIT